MSDDAKPCPESPKPQTLDMKITNDEPETYPVRRETNKKLSTISKESKRKKKLRKPEPENSDPLFKISSVDPMGVLAIIGGIIAGVSLYYTRKSALESQKQPQQSK